MSPRSPNDHPLALRPVDREIANYRGTTVPLEATQDNIQASKHIPTPSLSQMIEQRTRENGRLRKELACQHRKEGASMYFLGEVQTILEKLQQAVGIFEDLQIDIEEDLKDDVVQGHLP